VSPQEKRNRANLSSQISGLKRLAWFFQGNKKRNLPGASAHLDANNAGSGFLFQAHANQLRSWSCKENQMKNTRMRRRLGPKPRPRPVNAAWELIYPELLNKTLPQPNVKTVEEFRFPCSESALEFWKRFGNKASQRANCV